MEICDQLKWRCVTTLRKYRADIAEYITRHGKAEGERVFEVENAPHEERTIQGNLLLREGVKAIFDLLVGNTETAFSEANARIGVGDSTTAAADTQTGLLGSNTAFKGMDTSYPIVGALADKKVTFRASFGASEGNFAWEEWTVDNGSSANKNLNRKVEALGQKSGGTWQLSCDISLA